MMQLESLESMIKDYERRTGERVSLEGFYFDENNNYKDKYNYYFKWFLMLVSYSGLSTNMKAKDILLSGKHTAI